MLEQPMQWKNNIKQYATVLQSASSEVFTAVNIDPICSSFTTWQENDSVSIEKMQVWSSFFAYSWTEQLSTEMLMT